jgi:hypothetical protein
MTQPPPIHLKMVIGQDPWTRALEDGSIRIPGVTWETASMRSGPERYAAWEASESDVSDNGVRRAALDVIAGGPPVGLPVFLARTLKQTNILVRKTPP